MFEIERDPEPDLDELALYEAALDLQNGLLAHATGGSIRNADYQKLRRRLMNDGRSKVLVPTFVRTCQDPRLWGYIAHYAERSNGDLRGVSAFRLAPSGPGALVAG